MCERIERARLWILDVVVVGGCDIGLTAPGELHWHFFSDHRLDESELISLYQEMFDDGLIIASRDIDGEEDFIPNRTLIQAAIQTMSCAGRSDWILVGRFKWPISKFSFWMTPVGGALWEDRFVPDWGVYRHVWWDSETKEIEVSGSSKEIVRAWLDQYQPRGVGHSDPIWEKQTPWEATYWKTLPEGYVAKTRMLPCEESQGLRWWDSPVGTWYTVPECLR